MRFTHALLHVGNIAASRSKLRVSLVLFVNYLDMSSLLKEPSNE